MRVGWPASSPSSSTPPPRRTGNAGPRPARSVRLELAADGMAWLTAHLPAAAALAAYEHVDALAHTLPTEDTDGEPDLRSMDAKRADVLTGLLLGAVISPRRHRDAHPRRSTCTSSSTPAPRPTATDRRGMPGEVGPARPGHRRHPA